MKRAEFKRIRNLCREVNALTVYLKAGKATGTTAGIMLFELNRKNNELLRILPAAFEYIFAIPNQDTRIIFLDYYLNGWSQSQIADNLGMTQENVSELVRKQFRSDALP